MNIVDYIPYGRENAVTREQLMMLTGMPDRAVREAIAQARRDTVILNLQDGNGYYRPTEDDKPLVERFLRQETKRAKTIFYRLKAAREYLKG